mmetsp:Transcript_17181/g.51351  ORF Transcript_17181/g.51351 Transcript_17181/m.51351 type:complete len:238 (+) Transcript_17181:3265-3978(+)
MPGQEALQEGDHCVDVHRQEDTRVGNALPALGGRGSGVLVETGLQKVGGLAIAWSRVAAEEVHRALPDAIQIAVHVAAQQKVAVQAAVDLAVNAKQVAGVELELCGELHQQLVDARGEGAEHPAHTMLVGGGLAVLTGDLGPERIAKAEPLLAYQQRKAGHRAVERIEQQLRQRGHHRAVFQLTDHHDRLAAVHPARHRVRDRETARHQISPAAAFDGRAPQRSQRVQLRAAARVAQ